MEILRQEKGRGNYRLIKDDKGKFAVEYKLPDECNEWQTMGGSVGYNDSVFDDLERANRFLQDGLDSEQDNPDIWLEMLEVRIKKERG